MKLYDSDEYRASENWPYAVCAGCVVYRFNQNKEVEVLLLFTEEPYTDSETKLRYTTQYHLPKGHLESTETLEQGALRETAEEAGVDAKITTYLGTRFWAITHPKHKTYVEKTVHYFAAQWQHDLSEMDDEHDGKAWFSIQEAEEMLGKPNPKGEDEVIRRLKKFLELTA
jgi:8-oxo-dGTP pyrophosphatase MutT (NUDIX family)